MIVGDELADVGGEQGLRGLFARNRDSAGLEDQSRQYWTVRSSHSFGSALSKPASLSSGWKGTRNVV